MEAFSSAWPQTDLIYPGCCSEKTYSQSQINNGAFHIYVMAWSPSELSFTLDGVQAVAPYTSGIPTGPLFLIMQIQTGGIGGTPTNSNLPASMVFDYVKVCNSSYTEGQCSAAASNDPNVIFYDDFGGPAN